MFKLEDLKTRFWTSIIIVVGLGLLVFYLDNLVIKITLTAVFTGFLILTQWEFYQMTANNGFNGQLVSYLAAPCLLAAVLVALFNPHWRFVSGVILGAIVFLLFLEHFFKKNKPISSIAISLMGIFYIIVPLSFLLKITLIPYNGTFSGRWWIVFLIIVTKAADVGAYFIGKMVGKHYLAPSISPKKTYEGLIAGIVFSVGVSFALIYFTPQARALFCPAWAYALALGFFLAVIGLLGDLAESLIKRDADVKDSNKLKGFGGFLDMFDSLIFTAPSFYLFLCYGNFI